MLTVCFQRIQISTDLPFDLFLISLSKPSLLLMFGLSFVRLALVAVFDIYFMLNLDIGLLMFSSTGVEFDKRLVFWAGPQITSSIPHGIQIVLFEYQTHSQFASAFLGTGGRTKMNDEFAQKASLISFSGLGVNTLSSCLGQS